MIERVDLNPQEVALSRSYAPNPLDLRSGRSESSASQPRASRVIPPNPTRPARSHYWLLGNKNLFHSIDGWKSFWIRTSFPQRSPDYTAKAEHFRWLSYLLLT